jgi:hypothetical protein
MCLLPATTIPPGAQDSADPLTRKARLEARLDSLSLLTQQYRRQGRSIAELQRLGTRIRDTLSTLQTRISRLARQAPESLHARTDAGTAHAPFFMRMLPPRNPIEWIIAVLAAVGLLCCLILVIALVRLRRRPSKKTPRRPSPAAERTHRGADLPRGPTDTTPPRAAGTDAGASTPNDQAHPSASTSPPGSGEHHHSPARVAFFADRRTPAARSGAHDAHTAAGRDATASQPFDHDKIHQLRKRLHSEEQPSAPATQSPLQRPGKTRPQAPAAHTDANSFMSTKQLILQAAQKGMDVQDISKTYHVSVDHVYLILKMAGKKPGNAKPPGTT